MRGDMEMIQLFGPTFCFGKNGVKPPARMASLTQG